MGCFVLFSGWVTRGTLEHNSKIRYHFKKETLLIAGALALPPYHPDKKTEASLMKQTAKIILSLSNEDIHLVTN